MTRKFLSIVAAGTLMAIPMAAWSLYRLWWWVG